MAKKRKARKARKARTATARKPRVVVIAAPRRKRSTKRPAKRVGKPRKMGTRKSKFTSALMHGGAAFAGGYAAPTIHGYVSDMMPEDSNPTFAHGITAALGVALTMFAPTGIVGAAGLGLVGGAAAQFANDDAATIMPTDTAASATTRGRSALRGDALQDIRRKVRERMNGTYGERRVLTGVARDRMVITGTDNVAASSYNVLGSF